MFILFESGLNPTNFPSLRKFEIEITAMAASLLGGDNMAGTVTSGGVESPLMTVKTACDWARENYPEIKQPEMTLTITGIQPLKRGGIFLSQSGSCPRSG